MSTYELRARRARPRPERVREARLTVAVVAATVLALSGVGVIAALGADDHPGAVTSDLAAGALTPVTGAPAGVPAATVAAVAAATNAATAADVGKSTDGDLVDAVAADCTITATKLAMGDSGADVTCLQQGLINAGYTGVNKTGHFDGATFAAVKQMQTERDLFVDGVVGRETAISLNVWPNEQSFVVHTPAPAPGAQDTMGFPLSSVAVSGPDAPPLPANSGSGRRVVYDRRGQRVWAVDENEHVIRSWLVSGSKYGNEQPGVHAVFSRSETTTAWNGKAFLPMMIRYQKTPIGAIGFHAIPIHRADGTLYMTEDQLGTRLSGACQRQANADAQFMWTFAQVGTKVVVT